MSATAAPTSTPVEEGFRAELASSFDLCCSNLDVIKFLKPNEKLVFHSDGKITKELNSYTRSISSTWNYLGSLVSYSTVSESREIRFLQIFIEVLLTTHLEPCLDPLKIFTIIDKSKYCLNGLNTLFNTYAGEWSSKQNEKNVVSDARTRLKEYRLTFLSQKTELIAASPDLYFSEFSATLTNTRYTYLNKIAFIYAKTIPHVELMKSTDIKNILFSSKMCYTNTVLRYLKLSPSAAQSHSHYALAFSELIIHLFHPQKALIFDAMENLSTSFESKTPGSSETSGEKKFLKEMHGLNNLGEIQYFYQDVISWPLATDTAIDTNSVILDDELTSFIELSPLSADKES